MKHDLDVDRTVPVSKSKGNHMITDLRFLVSTFSREDRWKLAINVIAQFLLATMDLIGVAAILPLMQVLMGANLDKGSLGTLHRFLGDQSSRDFVLTLAGCMIAAFVLKALLALALNWWSGKLVTRLQTQTQRRLLEVYMGEGFLIHRRRNTGELIRTVGTAVLDAHTKVLGGMISVASSLMSMLLIVALLLIVSPVPTLVATAYFGLVVFFLQRLLGPSNRQAGREAQETAWISSHALFDAMHGFREAALHNARSYFVDKYDAANLRTARASLKANYLSLLPKYVLELVTMVGLTLFIVVTILTGTAKSAMPTLSLFVASTVKILPLMVALTATVGTVRVGREGLHITVQALKSFETTPDLATRHEGLAPTDDVAAADIHIENVSFRYPDGDSDVLTDISLDVPSGSSLALCGASGSGKTTLVDIILGLIPPTTGQVTYGGTPTTEAGPQWHDLVAYVPQDVYISDTTLAGNIAFGVPSAAQDRGRIRAALNQAALGDLVDSLPDGLDTLVGERGSRLSGGQKQRIGIARALYRRPRVLVLDEATSALDNETESRISDTLRSLRGDITTIIVAHRLSTVRDVDALAFLRQGEIEAVGTFDAVVQRSHDFKRLVELGNLDAQVGRSAQS